MLWAALPFTSISIINVYPLDHVPEQTERTQEIYPLTGQMMICCMRAENQLRKIILHARMSAYAGRREDPSDQMQQR